MYACVKQGTLRKGDPILFMAANKKYNAEEIGHLKMGMEPVKELRAGEVGYIVGSVKDVADTKVGDTITHQKNGSTELLPGYQDVKPMVFSGIYPTDSNDFEDLRGALEKLQLNDASLTYEPETSAALGFGFRCGFLGMLHMEIIQERLGPRVRPGHHHHDAQRALRRGAHERRGDRRRETPQRCPTRAASTRSASPTSRLT